MIGDVERVDLCQISLTGIRSLVLLGLLINSPMSLEDIRNAFLGYKIIDDSNSDDILRIDINTLRKMGCVISRADHRTNNKFVLLDHPFKIDITKEEISVIRRSFNKIKENADIGLLFLYDNLFKKIAPHIKDDELKESILGISPLKKYPQELLKELQSACKNKFLIKILYKSPASADKSEKEIYADKVLLQNDKLYLYGVDKGSNEPVYLNIKRILKILSIQKDDDIHAAEPITVRFKLKEFGTTGLADNEKIESGDFENGFIICGQYHNNFFATQRILSFGSKCTILEPESFKENVITILKRMRDVYNAK